MQYIICGNKIPICIIHNVGLKTFLLDWRKKVCVCVCVCVCFLLNISISGFGESDVEEQTLKFLFMVGFQPKASSMPIFGLNLAQFFSQPACPYPGYDQAGGYGA